MIGSKISELDGQLGGWRPSFDAPPSESKESGRMVKTVLGEFPEDFDGVINLYHHSWVIPDDIKPSFVIELVYEEGKLVSVDYGILPG